MIGYEFTVNGAKIPEVVVAGKRLGRHILHDSRSLLYVAEQRPITDVMHLTNGGLPLDQGQVGSCTANALVGALSMAPNYVAGSRLLTEADAVQLYSRETADEGSPYPPNDPGGSGVLVGTAAKELGWLTAYQTVQGVQAALGALVVRPVITGINWYDSFDQPESSGLVSITPGAQVRGGHEIVAQGIDVANKHVWFYNSWGVSYGDHGRFCMSWDTWDRLLQERGDVTVPVP